VRLNITQKGMSSWSLKVGRWSRNSCAQATGSTYAHDDTGVLASSLAKRAPGYTSLGFPDPRRSLSRR